MGDLVMQAGRPVLVVPPAAAAFRMDRVVVAWKDTREARRAAADALPLLKTASHVNVIEIASADDMSADRSRLDDVAGWLERQGVAVEIHVRPATRHREGLPSVRASDRERRLALGRVVQLT